MYNSCIVRHPAEGRVLGDHIAPAVLRHGLRDVLDGVEFAHHQKGVSVPAFPEFWKWFSYIFPTTFGCQAFINLNTAGGDLGTAHDQMVALTIQTIVYFALAYIAVYAENWYLHHKEMLKEKKRELAARAGVDLDEDRRIIAGDGND
mgnify:CR=1 FL=1